MSKIFDGIMGVVVGDALGVPVEFKERDSYEVTDMMQPLKVWGALVHLMPLIL